jgi:hypothetical protein
MLNLFYEEPEGDRWFPFDRYPRRVLRRLIRGRQPLRGHRRVFINLRRGLDRLGIKYRTNDHRHIQAHPTELACIIGKPFVLDRIEWKNPILFGPSGYSHPLDDPQLLTRRPIKKILVPGPWIYEMWKPYWGKVLEICPVGTDTNWWHPSASEEKNYDVLLYNKVLWNIDQNEKSLVQPIRAALKRLGHAYVELHYGAYREEEYRCALSQCKTMIFLCEHETQGIAYQEALSCGVPVIAWDRNGPWLDPVYYPHRVVYEPVTSVPYWDERCGRRFADFSDFEQQWGLFWDAATRGRFTPRQYILENLTLEKCAANYVRIADGLTGQMSKAGNGSL